MTYDNLFKDFIEDLFEKSRGFQVRTEARVGKLPLKIDVIIQVLSGTTPPLQPSPMPLLTTHFAEYNLVEFKSNHDRPRFQDLPKLVGYLGLFCAKEGIGIENLGTKCTAWYLCATRPSFLDVLGVKGILQPDMMPGLYLIAATTFCRFYVAILNELEVCEDNLPLLLHASGPPMRAALKLIEGKNLPLSPVIQKYLTLNYFINHKDVVLVTELEKILPKDARENIRLAVKHLGIKRVVEAVGITEVVKAIGITEVVKAIGIKEVVKAVGIKEVVKAVGIKEVLENFDLEEILTNVDLEDAEIILRKLKEQQKKGGLARKGH